LVLGQQQNKLCGSLVDGYDGQMTDFQIWREEAGLYDIHKMSVSPVARDVLLKLGKPDTPKTPQNQRVAFTTRQYSAEETKEPNPPVCEMDAFKKKETPTLPHVAGNMPRVSGTGDVHYMNFHHCRFDDQSVGEWVLAHTQPKWWKAAPMQIQFRTSPSRTNCPWCQNGAVSYIDGCAVKYKDEQASAGFGGYGFGGSYTPYAAMNGVQMRHGSYKRSKELEVRAGNHYFKAIILSAGAVVDCRRQAIFVTLPNKFKGKIWGLGGTGQGSRTDWMMGPNTDAYPQAKEGKQMPGLAGACHRRWQYTIRSSPFNGNHASKPLVKWFKSWQVDGKHIPSAFYYQPGKNHGPGSFNRLAGQNIKSVSNTNKRPSGKRKAAMEECKALRSTPKAREKCVFDFMMMGLQAIKDSRRDRMAQRVSKVKKPTKRTVRDVTQFRNDAEWSNHISWVCAGQFRRFQNRKRAEYRKARNKRIADRKEREYKARIKAQRIHANKNAPCPDGFKSTWHPEVFASKVPADKKQCAAGMIPVSAKSKGSHFESLKKKMSIILKLWMNGKSVTEELGEALEQSKDESKGQPKAKSKGQPKAESNIEKIKTQGMKKPKKPDPRFLSAGADLIIAGSNQPEEELELGEDTDMSMIPTEKTKSTSEVSEKKPKGAVSFVQTGEESGEEPPTLEGWGSKKDGGDISSVKNLKDVLAIAATSSSFAAITKDKNVVAWGNAKKGGDTSMVKKELTNIDSLYTTCCAYAALQEKTGRVITWGDKALGGDSQRVKSDLKKDVATVTGTDRAFAALKTDGKLVTWGDAKYGGDSEKIKKILPDTTGLKSIASTGYAFAGMTKSRRRSQILTWGVASYGGSYSKGIKNKLEDIKQLFSNKYAFAALTEKGDVVTWGHGSYGGNMGGAQSHLKDVVTIASTETAFAALTGAGKVITWGDSGRGGNSNAVRSSIKQGISSIYASSGAFAAKSVDGTVYTWGNKMKGGRVTKTNDAVAVGASSDAFAVVKKNGEVVHLTRPPPPPAPHRHGHCHYTHRGHTKCTDTGLNGCGSPMWDLSYAHNRRWPSWDHRLAWVFIYMDRWHGGCGVGHRYHHRWRHWCQTGNHQYNRWALCANGPGQTGRGGVYIQSLRGWRYYRVKVAGRMDSHNIWRTCKMHGYSTPCPGVGGNRYRPPAPKVADKKVQGLKTAFGNSKSFIGLRAPVSSLCKSRYGPSGRIDARCDDGWQEEGKSAGKPVCEDDNTNKLLPCSMLKSSCRVDAVQAKCAATCNTFDKGGKECKMIARERDQYKCVRGFSCQPMNKAFVPRGMMWTKPRATTHGCGSQARLEVATCSMNPKAVKCGCKGAYEVNLRSMSRSDCSKSDYADESKRILDRLATFAPETSQWATSCTGMPESAAPYETKSVPVKPLAMKNGELTVWRLKEVHAMSVPMEQDGCAADFSMGISLCNTAPFKKVIMQIPFSGARFVTVGCGCQEILARSFYNAQITAMENKMQATQDTCAKHFATWVNDFHHKYYFGGMNYYAHAIRLAKEVRKQCVGAGVSMNPRAKYKYEMDSIANVMKRNQDSIKKQEKHVQAASEQVLRLQKTKAQCLARLPKKSDNYKERVDEFAIEPERSKASDLKSEVLEMKNTLDTRDHNDAKLASMSTPAM